MHYSFGGNNFNYFLEHRMTKVENLVQFKPVFMSCLKDWEGHGLSGSPYLHH